MCKVSRTLFRDRSLVVAGLLVALAGRLDATGTLAGPASTAPTPGALA